MEKNEMTARERVAIATKEINDIIVAFYKAQEQMLDGMPSRGGVLDVNIKNGNTLGDIRLMCEFLQKYVIPNGDEQDGKFIFRGHTVDVTEINSGIHEVVRYLYNIVKQFGY